MRYLYYLNFFSCCGHYFRVMQGWLNELSKLKHFVCNYVIPWSQRFSSFYLFKERLVRVSVDSHKPILKRHKLATYKVSQEAARKENPLSPIPGSWLQLINLKRT